MNFVKEIDILFKTLFKLIFISIVIQIISVKSESFVSMSCNHSQQLNPCIQAISRCNRRLGYCQCKPGYPIPVPTLGVCLDYRSLGKECILSQQCRQTTNAVCVNSERLELNDSGAIGGHLLIKYFENNLIGVTNKYLNHYIKNNKLTKGYKSLGRCRCRTGFKSNGKLCQNVVLSDILCFGSHICQQRDLNSHCDGKSMRCYCDAGYVFDTDRNECRMTLKRFGDICSTDFECQSLDPNMECRYFQCLCQKGFDFDTQKCKRFDKKIKSCGQGFRFDERTGDCQFLPLYDVKGSEYRLFSADKLLETIVIVIFCCVTIAVLRFWRNILPQHITNNSQSGMFSEFTQTNRVRRRRSSRNSLTRSGRVIQLRVNLDSPESQYSQYEDTFASLPLTASQSSLPPYEATNSSLHNDSQPPPYSDEPPTYEEAIALSQIDENHKSEDKL